MRQTKISVVAPFFNEGAGVDLYFSRMAQLRAELPDVDVELVCVDDGSCDDTLARLIHASRTSRGVRVVELSRNFGKEAALTAGIDEASGDAVIPIDADLQDPPDLIPAMIARWRAGAEVVLARRADRRTDSYLKRTTAAIFYRVHNRLSKVRIPENVGDFRLMDRCVVDALRQLPERQRFMKGLFAWVGFRTEVVEYIRPERAIGDTKFSVFKLWELALEGITSFSTAPLRVWTYIGVAGAAATSLYAVFIVARTLIMGADVPGYASLLVAVLFVGSLQLISVGLLGEYIGRIYLESKQRPVYLVRRIHESKMVDADQVAGAIEVSHA